MEERRRHADRRTFNISARAARSDRRNIPDRRLNNIAAEWVPINHVDQHPATRQVFRKRSSESE